MGKDAEVLSSYIVNGGNLTVNVIEEGNRHLSVTVAVEDCPRNLSDATLRIKNKSYGSSGLIMNSGCA